MEVIQLNYYSIFTPKGRVGSTEKSPFYSQFQGEGSHEKRYYVLLFAFLKGLSFINQPTLTLFFVVKELIILKRCRTTYFRQARRLSNLTRDDILQSNQSDLARYNRGYQAFKSLRGSAMYYQESKKNLFATIRQFGCPTLFLTLNSNEFDWPILLKEILETELRRKVSEEEIESLSNSEKNKIVARNPVISTLHFHKRIEKMFKLMEKDFFETEEHTYHVNIYFFRIEFQQRGK